MLKPQRKRAVNGRRKCSKIDIRNSTMLATPLVASKSTTRKSGVKPRVTSATADVSQALNDAGAAITGKSRPAVARQARKSRTLVAASLAHIPRIASKPQTPTMTLAERRAQKKSTPHQPGEFVAAEATRHHTGRLPQGVCQEASSGQRRPPLDLEGLHDRPQDMQRAQPQSGGEYNNDHYHETHMPSPQMSTPSNSQHGDCYSGAQYNTPLGFYDRCNLSNPYQLNPVGHREQSQYEDVYTQSLLRLQEHRHHSTAIPFPTLVYSQNEYRNAASVPFNIPGGYGPSGGSPIFSNCADGIPGRTESLYPDTGHLGGYNNSSQPQQHGYQETSGVASPQRLQVYHRSVLPQHPNRTPTRLQGHALRADHQSGFVQYPMSHAQDPPIEQRFGTAIATQMQPQTSSVTAVRGWQDAHRNRFSGMHPAQIKAILEEEQCQKRKTDAQQLHVHTSIRTVESGAKLEVGTGGEGNSTITGKPRVSQLTPASRAPPATPPAQCSNDLPQPRSPDDAEIQAVVSEPSQSDGESPTPPTKRRHLGATGSGHETRVSTPYPHL